MIFLAEFSVIKPDFGLFFWTLLIFLLLLSLLAKFAFRPMVEALNEREKTIADSLAQADNARSEMANLKSQNEALLAQAREERTQILKEAKEMGDGIVADAKTRAQDEARKITQAALAEVENQKRAALAELKNKSGQLALDIAGKVLRRELSSNPEQQRYVNSLTKEINLN